VRYLSVFLLLANCVMADTVFFRDGRTINGSFVGGDARTIRVAVGDRVETIRVADVDRISFGDPEQSYAPPVLRTPPEEPAYRPAPPPPPPPAVVCSPGPFIVFFEWDKSDITPEAASILDNAISQYANCGNAQVMLAGHADRSGSAKYNVGLSQRRADAVKAYMVAHSIPDGVISEQAFGESRPRVETADGVREVQNRRVEITYGPSSGQ